MATAKKAPAKKAAPATKAAAPAKKAAAPAKAPRKANAAFLKPLTPSPELAAVIGAAPLPRTEVTRQIWDYIKKHNLQDAANRRNINADAKLKVLFGKDQVTMFELTKIVSGHLK
jgi:upstream activation factor subunit UAF30